MISQLLTILCFCQQAGSDLNGAALSRYEIALSLQAKTEEAARQWRIEFVCCSDEDGNSSKGILTAGAFEQLGLFQKWTFKHRRKQDCTEPGVYSSLEQIEQELLPVAPKISTYDGNRARGIESDKLNPRLWRGSLLEEGRGPIYPSSLECGLYFMSTWMSTVLRDCTVTASSMNASGGWEFKVRPNTPSSTTHTYTIGIDAENRICHLSWENGTEQYYSAVITARCSRDGLELPSEGTLTYSTAPRVNWRVALRYVPTQLSLSECSNTSLPAEVEALDGVMVVRDSVTNAAFVKGNEGLIKALGLREREAKRQRIVMDEQAAAGHESTGAESAKGNLINYVIGGLAIAIPCAFLLLRRRVAAK